MSECDHKWVGVSECKFCGVNESVVLGESVRNLTEEKAEIEAVAEMWRGRAREHSDERRLTVQFLRTLSGLDINNSALLVRLADKIESGAHTKNTHPRAADGWVHPLAVRVANGGKET